MCAFSPRPLPISLGRRCSLLENSVMATPTSDLHSLTDAVSSLSCSPQSILHVHPPVSHPSPSMKDVSTATRVPRFSVYKKRQSPSGGISKSRKESPLRTGVLRKSPRAVTRDVYAQRQREASIMAYLRELASDDDYRDDITGYMHEMEVSSRRLTSRLWWQ